MSDGRGDDELTTEEAAAVLRRAAELDEAAAGPAVTGRVHVSSLEQAAVEVGVAPEAIRRALAELRVGALPVGPTTGGSGTGRAPSRAGPGAGPEPPADGRVAPAALRLVEQPAPQVLANLEHLLRQQLFELRRREGDHQLWRRRHDRAAGLQRRIDASGRLVLGDIQSVAVSVSAVDHRPSPTLVRLEAEVTPPEGVVSPGAVVAGGGAALFAMTPVEPVALVLGAGAAALAARRLVRRRVRQRDRHREAAELLDWLLDQLEPTWS